MQRLRRHTDNALERQRWLASQAPREQAEAEYRARVNALSAEYLAARAAGDVERAAALKDEGAALINARYGL